MRKSRLICLFVVSCITFIFLYYFKGYIDMDEIWNYGFGYNIASGMVPYRDFNMIVTPLYPFLLSIFIKIIGNTFFSLIIFNSVICSLMLVIIYKMIGKKSLLLIPIICYLAYTGYNLLSILLFLLFLSIKDSKLKHKDLFVGFIVLLLVLTKQTVGGLIFIFYFIYSKNKKEYLLGFLPFAFIFFGYLYLSNSFFDFWNYCLFGMFDFTNKNGLSGVDFFFFFYLLSLIYLLFLLIKSKFKNWDLVYILLFQIMTFPILDCTHSICAIFPFVVFLLKKNNLKYKNVSVAVITFYLITAIVFQLKDNLNLNFYQYENNNSFLNHQRISFPLDSIYELDKYITDNFSDGTKFYFTGFAYLIKLELGEKITKYDLINNGNMGYHGQNKYIDEVDNYCNHNKCIFVIQNIDDIRDIQENKEINHYVKNTYNFETQVNSFLIFSNAKMH